jgi:hypothetical protein
MEFIPGVSLQERIDRSAPLDLNSILRIGMQAATGLAAAHAQGLVHRDIKPANILLENCIERVKITDFGLARAVDDASLTQSGVVAGTPLYMAPEQARCETIDHRADLFSLGAVLYAMCTGRSPFRAPTTMGVLRRVCHDTPRPVREVNPDVPDFLAAMIDRLLDKDPAARFSSADELAQVLGEHLARKQRGLSDDDRRTVAHARPIALADDAVGSTKGRTRRYGYSNTVASLLVILAGLFVITEVTGITTAIDSVAHAFRTPNPEISIFKPYPDIRVLIDGMEVGHGVDGIISSFDPHVPGCLVDVFKGDRRTAHEWFGLKQGILLELKVDEEGRLWTVHEGPKHAASPWWRRRSRAGAGVGADGRPIGTFDASPIHAAEIGVKKAEGDLDSAKAKLALARLSVEQAESNLEVSKEQLTRTERLAAAHSVTTDELEQARCNCLTAESDRDVFRAGLTEAEADLEAAHADVIDAQARLDWTKGGPIETRKEIEMELHRRRAEIEPVKASAAVARAKAGLDRADAIFKRQTSLLERTRKLKENAAISREDLDDAIRRFQQAEVEKLRAETNLVEAEARLTTTQWKLKQLKDQ